MNEKQKIIDKKNIPPKTAVKGLINGFVSYGILLIFVFLAVVVFVTWVIDNKINVANEEVLEYTLPLIASILIFFLVRFTCKLSTFDLFKNCRIEEKEVDRVCVKMNLFYICVVAFSVVIIIVYLLTRFSNERIQILRDTMIYHESNSVYAEEKEQELIEEYELNKSNTLLQTLIVEMGLLLGIFSLIPNQKRLIDRYN